MSVRSQTAIVEARNEGESVILCIYPPKPGKLASLAKKNSRSHTKQPSELSGPLLTSTCPPIATESYVFTFTPPSSNALLHKSESDIADDKSEQPVTQKLRTSKKHEAQKWKRQSDQVQNPSTEYEIRMNTLIRLFSEARPIALSFDSRRAISASSGYIGRSDPRLQNRIWRLDELVGPTSLFDFQLISWDRKHSIPIVDHRDGRILCILISNPPNNPSWQDVHCTAFQELTAVTAQLSFLDLAARRRVLKYLTAGYSFGGGQKAPKHFNLSAREEELLQPLLSSQAFARIAGHINAAFATWAPRLHAHYSESLRRYCEHDPNFSPNFPSSVFAAATFNLDEQTLTAEHLDYFNFLFGLCSVTALGDFNPTVGAHMILWDLQVVIEFPPGTSMLIPSCWCWHSNSAMTKGGVRHSFVQYSAGGLFRYDNDGMRTWASMNLSERKS
ncbi:hypothetical protein VKT23_020560 [Stygiomarasmius scandens]|uniref:Uncharacterized protein n=1 Tax=Marasmiellus scandens TaxID=2682957 RepID=A0ABR1IIS7_9AGAR